MLTSAFIRAIGVLDERVVGGVRVLNLFAQAVKIEQSRNLIAVYFLS